MIRWPTPSIVLTEPNERSQPQPVPATEAEPEIDETAVAPIMPSADIETDNQLSLLPPQAALEPIEEPNEAKSEETPPDPTVKETAVESPPGDDTPTSSIPSPGRMGNDQPTDPGFESNPPILYPPEAIRDGIEGTVILRIRIAVDGQVVAVDVVKSSGSSMLDRAAIEGVRTWHGRPAQIAGHAIEAAALLPVVFRLH